MRGGDGCQVQKIAFANTLVLLFTRELFLTQPIFVCPPSSFNLSFFLSLPLSLPPRSLSPSLSLSLPSLTCAAAAPCEREWRSTRASTARASALHAHGQTRSHSHRHTEGQNRLREAHKRRTLKPTKRPNQPRMTAVREHTHGRSRPPACVFASRAHSYRRSRRPA
eukprot:6181473-Pleurochrysis_carterae.AAC.1